MICIFCNSDRIRRIIILVKSSGVSQWKCLDCGARWAE